MGIGDSAFRNNTSITTVIIPDSVTVIGASCFDNCSLLANVVLSNNLVTIGSYAFRDCIALVNITIPGSVEFPAQGGDSFAIFKGCTNLISIKFEEGITVIPQACCMNCYNLSIVNLPNSVTLIDHSAFASSYSLEYIDLPDNLEKINEGAFYDSGLKSISIPEAITYMGYWDTDKWPALGNCRFLTTIVLEGDRKKIPDYLCYMCPALTTVIMPDSITEIGNYAFYGCTGLKSNLTLPSNLKHIGIASFAATKDLYIELPEGLISIGPSAFTDAFYDNAEPVSLDIPRSVRVIRDYAFQYNPRLERVRFIENINIANSNDIAISTNGHTDFAVYDFSVLRLGKSIFSGTPVTVECVEGSFPHIYAIDNGIEVQAYPIQATILSSSIAEVVETIQYPQVLIKRIKGNQVGSTSLTVNFKDKLYTLNIEVFPSEYRSFNAGFDSVDIKNNLSDSSNLWIINSSYLKFARNDAEGVILTTGPTVGLHEGLTDIYGTPLNISEGYHKIQYITDVSASIIGEPDQIEHFGTVEMVVGEQLKVFDEYAPYYFIRTNLTSTDVSVLTVVDSTDVLAICQGSCQLIIDILDNSGVWTRQVVDIMVTDA